MPTRKPQSVRVVERKERFNLANSIGVAVVGLLVSLLGTGVAQMISLSAHVATLAEAQTRTENQLSKHLDNSVAKDVYDRRDRDIQKQLNDKASKDEIVELRAQVKDQLVDLKEALRTMQDGIVASRRSR